MGRDTLIDLDLLSLCQIVTLFKMLQDIHHIWPHAKGRVCIFTRGKVIVFLEMECVMDITENDVTIIDSGLFATSGKPPPWLPLGKVVEQVR